MLVFTQKNVECIQQKYSSFPSHRIPTIYWVATLPDYEDQRNTIEQWVARLPDHKREGVIGRLLSEQHYWDTYNELRIGDALINLGHRIEYERPIPSISGTPDWYVTPQDETPAFYVEVFTPNPSNTHVKDENKWHDLRVRLEKMSLDVALTIRVHEECNAPDDGQAKSIARIVRRWLEETSPSHGEVLRLDPESWEPIKGEFIRYFRHKIIEFEVSKKDNIEPGKGWCIGPFLFVQIEVTSLKKNVKDKTRRYKYLEGEQTPFVIALVPHPDSPLSHDSIDDAIQGDLVTRVYSRGSAPPIAFDDRLKNGLFTGRWKERSVLSAVVWFSRVSGVTVYHNPHATNPLSPELLDFSRIEI